MAEKAQLHVPGAGFESRMIQPHRHGRDEFRYHLVVDTDAATVILCLDPDHLERIGAELAERGAEIQEALAMAQDLHRR